MLACPAGMASGSTKPSQANQAAFDEAVEAVAHATQHLLEHLTTVAPPKNREDEAVKARVSERWNELGIHLPPHPDDKRPA